MRSERSGFAIFVEKEEALKRGILAREKWRRRKALIRSICLKIKPISIWLLVLMGIALVVYESILAAASL